MIGQAIARYAASDPARTAVEYSDHSISWRELQETIDRRRNQLHAAAGPLFQKQIAFALQDPLEQLYMFFAVVSGGGIAVPVDEAMDSDTKASLLSSSRPGLFIADTEAAGLPVPSLTLADVSGAESYPSAFASFCEETDLFYGACTSGTSGRPKVCLRSHRSWLKSFEADEQLFPFQDDERVLITGKLSHSLFLYGAVRMLEHGHTVILPVRHSPRVFDRMVDEQQITVLYAVPTTLRWLLSHSFLPSPSVRLIITGGEKWFPADNQKTFARFPSAELYEFYGSAETSFISALNHREEQVSSSCTGRLFPMVEAESSTDSGELVVTSPFLFSGYAGDAPFHPPHSVATGDIGSVDEEGFLYVTGRRSGKIVSRGRNIYAEEIEQVLMSHPDVDRAVVFGAHDTFQGEKVAALYTGRAAPGKLRAHCRQQLPAYKIPACQYIDRLPVLGSGKVDRPGAQKYYEALSKENGNDA
ncbi:long-chain acyl-CoA synthetase [Marinococcus luteus]|uniref:Long-chain acyl-CoA synthetase n=1 Tax=Marinococcus luteus TaxID=1122204 RepID=A0A1H2T931_9BACI|nr:AMP-binding protein [Marinococcus luteus]SDW40453.1 long-chain acyl-CoA synthetase [Marinococcus luteus]